MSADLLFFYQNLPLVINPVVFKIGFFSVSWYALMYIASFAVVYSLLLWRIKKKEGFLTKENIQEFLIGAFFGVVIGGRLGYVLFYNLPFYWDNPLAIISPFSNGEWTGIYGMSYHGGLIGVLLAAFWFSRKNKINFSSLTDFVVPAISAGYFFGRLGNFLNGELYGRITQSSWGMYFPGEIMLRHPSQLYEAFLEGIILFLILWVFRNNQKVTGKFLPLYILGYSCFRFLIEFFREPDEQIGLLGNFLTLGQVFSLAMAVLALSFLVDRLKQRKTLENS